MKGSNAAPTFAVPSCSCQVLGCAEVNTYPADMLRVHPVNGKPICESCWEYDDANCLDEAGEESVHGRWSDLQPIDPLAWASDEVIAREVVVRGIRAAVKDLKIGPPNEQGVASVSFLLDPPLGGLLPSVTPREESTSRHGSQEESHGSHDRDAG